MLYFDHAASTALYPEVIDLIKESLEKDFANPASKHKLGQQLAKSIESSRKTILSTLGAQNSYQLIFTSSATESNNTVIRSFLERGEVLCKMSDHPSVSRMIADHDNGIVIVDSLDIIEAIKPETVLVVLSHVNSQAGLITNVEEVSKHIKDTYPNIQILVDASQSYGKIPLDLKDSNVDYVSIASHKIGGPRGISALVLKDGKEISPLLIGGGHESGLRSSTPATSLIKGFELAASISNKNINESFKNVNSHTDKIINELRNMHQNFGIPFEGRDTSPYIICVTFKGLPSDVLLRHLEQKNIFISSTTACSSKIKGYNPVFEGLGIDKSLHKNVLRISLSAKTTNKNVQGLLDGISEVINEISFLIK